MGTLSTETVPEIDRKSYSVVTFDTRSLTITGWDNTRPVTVPYEHKGTYFYCRMLTGPLPVYVRLGDRTNPYIRLTEGMLLHRDYSRVTFAMFDPHVENQSPSYMTRAVCYCSVEPLFLIDPRREYGMRTWPYVGTATATTTGVPLVPLDTYGYCHTAGKVGGALMVVNVSLGATVYLIYKPRGTDCFPSTDKPRAIPIEPGQSFSADLDDVFETYAHTWKAFVESGTADVRVVLSTPETDRMDAENFMPGGLSP